MAGGVEKVEKQKTSPGLLEMTPWFMGLEPEMAEKRKPHKANALWGKEKPKTY